MLRHVQNLYASWRTVWVHHFIYDNEELLLQVKTRRVRHTSVTYMPHVRTLHGYMTEILYKGQPFYTVVSAVREKGDAVEAYIQEFTWRWIPGRPEAMHGPLWKPDSWIIDVKEWAWKKLTTGLRHPLPILITLHKYLFQSDPLSLSPEREETAEQLPVDY